MSNASDPFYYPPDSPELRALAVRGFTIHFSVWLCAMALVAAVDSKVRRAVLLSARRRSSGGGSRASTIERLDASMDAAAFLRVRISFAMLALGELLFLLGITPFGLITSGLANIRAVAGPSTLWALLVPPGLLAMMASVVPTDRLVIRGLCIFFVVIFAVEVFFFAIRAHRD